MEPLALTTGSLLQPWRLWTCHLAHFGWEHALGNLVALTVPLLLAPRQARGRLCLALLVGAPLLSLLLLPALGHGQYRGASGLACLAWSWVGLHLLWQRGSGAMGLLLLGALALKLALETGFGMGPLRALPGWQNLPLAHYAGALLGLVIALPWARPSHSTHPHGA